MTEGIIIALISAGQAQRLAQAQLSRSGGATTNVEGLGRNLFLPVAPDSLYNKNMNIYFLGDKYGL